MVDGRPVAQLSLQLRWLDLRTDGYGSGGAMGVVRAVHAMHERRCDRGSRAGVVVSEQLQATVEGGGHLLVHRQTESTEYRRVRAVSASGWQ